MPLLYPRPRKRKETRGTCPSLVHQQGESRLGPPLEGISFGFRNRFRTISDHYNDRIRKVTKSTGKIATVAGNGDSGYAGDGGPATSAGLWNTIGIALDSAGNIYIADTNDQRVRKVTVSSGIISTVAGNGIQADTGDGGLATSAELAVPYSLVLDAAGYLYVTDSQFVRAIGP